MLKKLNMTKVLSEDEIEKILDFIKPNIHIPSESAIASTNLIKERFKKQLRNQKIYQEIIPELKKQLYKNYIETQIQPGESVGIISAMSIGEKNTQSTLNTFHKAGQSEKQVTQGVPRFQELLNATKTPRIVNCKIYFKDGNKSVQELRETIGNKLVCLTLNDLSKSMEVLINKEYETWYETFKILYNDNFTKSSDCISIKLNTELMFKHKLNVSDIVKVIENEYDDLWCVFSPLNNEQLDIFVDTSSISFSEERLLFINPDNVNEIYIEECVQPILSKMVICGIPGIENIYYTQEKDEWFVETDGSNFKKLLGYPIVDMTRLHSNNVWDIFETLGIEAAREFLINEFISIMEGINACHVKLLVEKMTYTGNISSISRYTLRKDESGPLAKSSFEESVDNFLRAGFNCDVEKIRGVSASIITGKRAKMGTGMVDLKIDIDQLKNAIPVFLDEKNQGVVIEQRNMTKIKPYSGRL
jgi:DNA-directed RNA polymerase beta' subunit